MRRPSVELRLVAAGGRETRLRLAGPGGALVVATLLGLIVALGFALVSAPSAWTRARDRRAMDIALERRAQLGERLRALVERYQELDVQVRAHAELVDRIRLLYELPDLPPAAAAAADRPPPRSIFAGALIYTDRLDAVLEAVIARSDALIAVLALWEREHPEEVRAVPASMPLRAADAVTATGFGERRHPLTGEPEFHAGIDLAAPAGAGIRAPAAGIVRFAGEAPPSAGEAWWRLGRVVVVAHGSRYLTIHGHCDRILVGRGQRVAAGQTIAQVGNSGWTPSPRLHFEVRRNDGEGEWRPVDPARLWLDPAVRSNAAFRAAEVESALPWPPLPRAFAR